MSFIPSPSQMDKSFEMMKKIILILVAAIVAVTSVSAQSKRDSQVAKSKATDAAKNLKKEKFKTLDGANPYYDLEEIYLQERNGKTVMIGLGKASKFNNARNLANAYVRNEYATNSCAMVKGRIVNNTSKIGEEEVEDIVAAYEALVLEEIKGALKEALVLKKENKDGDTEVRAFWLVDIEAAHAARMKAMQHALDELQLSQKYGSEVSGWIDDGLNK